jgi:hypothetical protein
MWPRERLDSLFPEPELPLPEDEIHPAKPMVKPQYALKTLPFRPGAAVGRETSALNNQLFTDCSASASQQGKMFAWNCCWT